MIKIDSIDTEIVVEADGTPGGPSAEELDEEAVREMMRRVARREHENALRTGAGE